MDDHAYERHPASAIFPETSEEEHKAMVDDIYEHGLNEEIVLCDSKILDGWNRYRACLAAGVLPKFKQWDRKGSVLEYVQRKNLIRRHMTQSQRAMVAETIARLLSDEIREEKKQNAVEIGKTGGRGKRKKSNGDIMDDEKGFHNNEKTLSDPVSKPRNAIKEAAKAANVSPTYVSAARKITDSSPEVADKVRQGQKSIPQATRELGLNKSKDHDLASKLYPLTGKSKVNDELVDDPPDIAKRRQQGKIAQNAIPEIDDPGEDVTSFEAIKEEHAERKAIQDDLNDEDWLATFPLRELLTGPQRKMFDWNAIAYRSIRDLIGQLKYAIQQIPTKERKGPYIWRALSLVRIDSPDKWLRCPPLDKGGCAGEGMVAGMECPMCKGEGFWVQH